MDDVTDKQVDETKPAESVPATPSTEGETSTPEANSQKVSEAIPNPEVENYKKALQQERERRKTYERDLAAYKSKEQQGKYDPEDYSQWMSHPYSQELLVKVAKQELTDFARETLADERYSSLNSQVKKAILANVRGFVKEATTDVESAKIDLIDYIEEILQDTEAENPVQPVAPQPFQVAAPNAGVSESETTPAEINSILEKSPLDWTDEETNTLEAYQKSQGKKLKK